MISNLAPRKTRHADELFHIKSVDAQSPTVGVMWMFREKMSSQMSSSSFEYGSKIRGPFVNRFVVVDSR
ncbi:hypothetical protein TNCV_4807951 [Trichonephila clavipes]|nr:hypothetical protein TNCV_4807951 [Trichonephila clavipes]